MQLYLTSALIRKSNAVLITAAPELLEASKAALDFLKGNSVHSKERIIQLLEKAEASAALKKGGNKT